MIHGYHVILPCYGFWLPNDPRGSWSHFVHRWELVRFGTSTRCLDQRTLAQLTDEERISREQARSSLKYPPVTLTGLQALSIANGFATKAARNSYRIWACAILPEHTHLVIARHTYKCEQIANQLKDAATRRLVADNRHPMLHHKPGRRPPKMWAERLWKVYLDSDEQIENAIAYVIDNPIKEGKRRQEWKFVTPYAGLDAGWVTY